MNYLCLKKYKRQYTEALSKLDDSPRQKEFGYKKITISPAEYDKSIQSLKDQTLYAVFLDNEIIGSVVFRDYNPIENKRAYIDYYLDKSQQGKGYGSQIVNIIIELAKTMKLNKLMADPSTRNIPSCRILEKNGFRLIGVMKRHERQLNNNSFEDKALYEYLLAIVN